MNSAPNRPLQLNHGPGSGIIGTVWRLGSLCEIANLVRRKAHGLTQNRRRRQGDVKFPAINPTFCHSEVTNSIKVRLMESGNIKFGRGPRELTGGMDLISHYKLLPFHEFFCKKAWPVSVLDTHYLRNVVGDTDIRKGEGMQLAQLVRSTPQRDTNPRIQPLRLDLLGEAFRIRDSSYIDLPPSEKGIPTIAVKHKSKSKTKDKHKKHKDKDGEKDKEVKKHKRDEEMEKKQDKKNQKRKHDNGGEDGNGITKHKKSKIIGAPR